MTGNDQDIIYRDKEKTVGGQCQIQDGKSLRIKEI